MNLIVASIVSFVLASIIAVSELVTTKYPRTSDFIKGCGKFYLYITIYGFIAFFVSFCFEYMLNKEIIEIKGIDTENIWIRAIIIGISVKALLHISVFSVGVGEQNTPIGTETITKLFEPWLLEQIELYEFNNVRNYIKPIEQKYTENSSVVRAIILDNLPYTFTGSERITFEVAIKNRKNTNMVCMEMYLRRFGRKNFERAFAD